MNNPLYQQYNSSNSQTNSFIQRFNQFRQSFTGSLPADVFLRVTDEYPHSR